MAIGAHHEPDGIRRVAVDPTSQVGVVHEPVAELGQRRNSPASQWTIGISQSTEERLTSLNALAEHVSHKAKALESQQQSVEHAVVQANRVNEMVWSMDVQIAKLNEGMKQAAKAEDTIGRIEKLAQETNAQLDTATKTRQEAERATGKLTKDAGALLDAAHRHPW